MMPKLYIAVLVLLVSAFVLQVHHYRKHGYWFDKTDLDCHEVWFIGILCVAGGILIEG